jgi:hypothetical protein
MQTTSPISSHELQNCMVTCGRWAYAQGVGSNAMETYQRFYETYLAAESITVTTAQPAPRTGQQPARPRTRTGAGVQTPTRTRPPRTRTAAGTPGPKDARVLAKIVSTPGITAEALRKTFARSMEPNILGTSLGRLLKGNYISGTAKVGPFNATATGIAANQKQPTSINTRRRPAAVKVSPPSEPAGQLQQTG